MGNPNIQAIDLRHRIHLIPSTLFLIAGASGHADPVSSLHGKKALPQLLLHCIGGISAQIVEHLPQLPHMQLAVFSAFFICIHNFQRLSHTKPDFLGIL